MGQARKKGDRDHGAAGFGRFPEFEKTLHYQFPGLMSSPCMSRRPGGEASVKLYVDYQRFLVRGLLPWVEARK